MYYVAAALLGLSGLFYSAGHGEMGSYSASVCSYGSALCDNPLSDELQLKAKVRFPATVELTD